MQSVLAFTPFVSPTYVPLGLSQLSAHVNESLSNGALSLIDLNRHSWHRLAQSYPEGEKSLIFFKTDSPAFYNPQIYNTNQALWSRVSEMIRYLSERAKRYVETGEICSELRAILDDYVSLVMKNDPRIIGLSLMYLDQLNFTLALAKYISGLESGTERKVVLGGAALFALDHMALFEACPYIDCMITGEGEDGFTALVRGDNVADIPGLIHREVSGIVVNPPQKPGASPCFLSSDFSQLNPEFSFNPEPVLPVVFSRDCQWGKCRFCAHNLTFSGFRKRTVAHLVDDLERLQNEYGVRHFYFTDQYISPRDMEKISDEILARGLRISYHVMCRPIVEYTPARLEKMSLSGCRWISWGIESGSKRLLDLIKKGTTVEGIETVVKNSARAGISNLAMMIYGLPTSTEIDARQTYAMLDNLQDSFDLIRSSVFVLYKDTYFGKHWRQFGLQVTGDEVLLDINGSRVRSTKLRYKEIAHDGSLRPPSGRLELSEWEKRQMWMKDTSFMEKLPCEHYLLYVSQPSKRGILPDSPTPLTA